MNAPLIDSGLLALLEGRDLNIQGLMDGLFGGSRRSARYGSSAEFTDFREYQPGDDLRHVDWNLFGRLDKLYLRLYADERRQHHRFLIDCSASMAWGRPEKHRTALQLAAVLGYLAVANMDTVSFYALQGSTCRRIGEPVTGRDAWYRATEELGRLGCSGDTKLDEAVRSYPDHGHHDGVTFLISDLLTESDWKAALDTLIGAGREVCLLQVLSRDELEPGFSGKSELFDIEAGGEGLRMDISRQRLQAYAEAVAWLREDIRSWCEGHGVRCLSLCTDEALKRVLLEKMTGSEMIL